MIVMEGSAAESDPGGIFIPSISHEAVGGRSTERKSVWRDNKGKGSP